MCKIQIKQYTFYKDVKQKFTESLEKCKTIKLIMKWNFMETCLIKIELIHKITTLKDNLHTWINKFIEAWNSYLHITVSHYIE